MVPEVQSAVPGFIAWPSASAAYHNGERLGERSCSLHGAGKQGEDKGVRDKINPAKAALTLHHFLQLAVSRSLHLLPAAPP